MWLVYLLLVTLFTQGFCAPVENANQRVKRQLYSPFGFDFGRPPTGIYHGGLGGAFGSPIFGPPWLGPFNNPTFREERILQLFDHNRRVNGRPTTEEQFRLNTFGRDYEDDEEPLRLESIIG